MNHVVGAAVNDVTSGGRTPTPTAPTNTDGTDGMVQQQGARSIKLRSWGGNGATASNPLLQQALSGLAQVRPST